MNLIQRIKCVLGFHYRKSYEYIKFDNGILILRCSKCKKQILIKPKEEDPNLLSCRDCGTTENVNEVGLCSFCEEDREEGDED